MLLTYLVVVVVVVAVLYGSFRALGGGEPVPSEDYRSLLARLAGYVADRAIELSDALSAAEGGAEPPAAAADSSPSPGGRAAADPLVELAGAARKKLGGYNQQLARVESAATGEERDRLEAARALLQAAIEDLGWACRMIESGTHRDSSGIRRAVAELRRDGADCLAAAQGIVGPQAVTGPREV